QQLGDTLPVAVARSDAALPQLARQLAGLLAQTLLRQTKGGEVFVERLLVGLRTVARRLERRGDHFALLLRELAGVVLLTAAAATTTAAALTLTIVLVIRTHREE